MGINFHIIECIFKSAQSSGIENNSAKKKIKISVPMCDYFETFISPFVDHRLHTWNKNSHTSNVNFFSFVARSPSTRLRLREGHLNASRRLVPGEDTLVWAIDDLYIGLQCQGHCSGHGQCTTNGCLLVIHMFFFLICLKMYDCIKISV